MKNLIFPLAAFIVLPIFLGLVIWVDKVEIAGTASEIALLDNTDVYQLSEDDTEYSQEVLDIYNAAVVDVRQQFVGEELVEIEVSISGDRQERVSIYQSNNDQLDYVRKETIIYQFPKWDKKHAPDISTTEVLELDFDLDGNLSELRKDDLVFDCASLDLCEREVSKAQHDFAVYRDLK